ncbi:unnamed protein product [Ranitomeya imitator]|uniref:Uncharacterized protein n=1 Tax=Ranitomeya imitator TaxID=111125 RepID=A0ABN9MEB1_9NEOB|nr:unnamed protein product [Ranitomeya imitator]
MNVLKIFFSCANFTSYYSGTECCIHSSHEAPLLHTKALTNVSWTLVTKEASSSIGLIPKDSVFSPLEGQKNSISNLHPRVTEEDSMELFCVCEVLFVSQEDAVGVYKKYNDRYLDVQPMKCNLPLNGSVITSEQPILLRLSDTPSKKECESRRNITSSSFSVA